MSDDPGPRRRSEPDRRRWNDQALDGLEARIHREERSVASLHGKFDRLEDRLDKRLQRIESSAGALVVERSDGTVRPIRSGLDWKTVLAIGGTIVVPIVVAIITTSGRL